MSSNERYPWTYPIREYLELPKVKTLSISLISWSNYLRVTQTATKCELYNHWVPAALPYLELPWWEEPFKVLIEKVGSGLDFISQHVRRIPVKTNKVIILVSFISWDMPLQDTWTPTVNPRQICRRFNWRDELLKQPIDKR